MGWWGIDSFEQAAFASGLSGVRCLAADRWRGDQGAPIIAESDVRALGATGLAPDFACCGLEFARSQIGSLFPQGQSEAIEEYEHRVDLDAFAAVAQLACLPLLALILKHTGRSLDGLSDDVPSLHERLDRLRTIRATGSVKAELEWYAERVSTGTRHARELSQRTIDAVQAEWKHIFVPPPREMLLKLLPKAERWCDAKALGEIGEFQQLVEAGAHAEQIVDCLEGIGPSATEALENARTAFVVELPHEQWVKLFAVDPEISAYFARRAAARRTGSRERSTALDVMARDLFDLHMRRNCRTTWDVRITGNRPTGDGYAFAGRAFRLYQLPWSDTSAHIVARAKRARRHVGDRNF